MSFQQKNSDLIHNPLRYHVSGSTRHKSPSLRSSLTNSSNGTKRTRFSPRIREEEYEEKGEILNSIAEHSAYLKRELDTKEKVRKLLDTYNGLGARKVKEIEFVPNCNSGRER